MTKPPIQQEENSQDSRLFAWSEDAQDFIEVKVTEKGLLQIEGPVGIEDTSGTQIDPLDDSALESVAQDRLLTSLEKIGGQSQSAVDVANKIDQIQGSLHSQGGDEMRTRLVMDSTGLGSEQEAVYIDSPTPSGTYPAMWTTSGEYGYSISSSEFQSVGLDNLTNSIDKTSSNSRGLLTYGDRALASINEDAMNSLMYVQGQGGQMAVHGASIDYDGFSFNSTFSNSGIYSWDSANSEFSRVNGGEYTSSPSDTDWWMGTDTGRALASVGNDELRTTGSSRDEVTDTAQGTDINSTTYTNQFDVTESMDSVTVAVDDASGAFHIEVAFQDGNGNDVVVRDDGNSSAFSGGSNTDAFVDVELASPQCEVRVVDDSGSSNNTDITVRAT